MSQLSAAGVELLESITISGELTPAPAFDFARAGPEFKVNFTRPDGKTMFKAALWDKDQYGWYTGDGTYSLNFMPDMVGTWTVKVQYRPSIYDPYNPSVSDTLTFTVTTPALPPAPPAPAVLPTEYIYIILAVAAIAVVAVAYLLLRRG